MTQEESEVPLNLQHVIAEAETDSRGVAMDLHPPQDWHDCPDCGNRLHAQSVGHNGDEILAVQYFCDCLALWTWKQPTDDLHYRGESELVDDF